MYKTYRQTRGVKYIGEHKEKCGVKQIRNAII